MGKQASHYHVVAAEMIGRSRYLKDSRDELYKEAAVFRCLFAAV